MTTHRRPVLEKFTRSPRMPGAAMRVRPPRSSGDQPPDELDLIPLQVAKVLVDTMGQTRLNTEVVLTNAGLEQLAQALRDGGPVTIPRPIFAALADQCVVALHNYACERENLRALPYSYFHLLCTSLIATPDLRTAIQIASQFEEMMLEGRGAMRLAIVGDEAILTLDLGHTVRDLPTLLVMMFALGSFHRIFSWLIRDEIRLSDVFLDFPAALAQPAFNILFQQEPKLEQNQSAIAFSRAYLDRPVSRTFGELTELFEYFPFDLFPPSYDQESLIERVRRATNLALSWNEDLPKVDQLARSFGMSAPTLRRRLAHEHATVNAIRKECRMKLAERLLCGSKLTIDQIAYRCGFSDITAFRRAFGSWFATTPSDYRAKAAKECGTVRMGAAS